MATPQSNHENPVMIESLSRYNFTETIDVLTNAVLANSWKVIATHDLQETMRKNGKEVLPVKVLEICKPDLAYQVLSRDEERHVSPMLPCRISVYDKTDDKTYVSRMNAPAFAAMIGGSSAATIEKAFSDAEGFIREVTE